MDHRIHFGALPNKRSFALGCIWRDGKQYAVYKVVVVTDRTAEGIPVHEFLAVQTTL
jgi:hypothetical protein